MIDGTFFKANYGGREYQGLYVREAQTAIEVLAKISEKDTHYVCDVETEPLPEYRLIKTAGLSPWLAKIRLLQIFDGKTAIVFDIKHIGTFEPFIEFLETKKLIAHNAMFETMFFKRAGVKKLDIGCTMIAAKLCFHALFESDAGLSASLDNLSMQILKIPMRKELQVSDWSIPNLLFEQIEYASIDVIATWLLADKLKAVLSNLGMGEIYKLYRESIQPISDIHLNGMKLDVSAHSKLIHVWKDELWQAKKALFELTGAKRITSTTMAEYIAKTLPKETLAIWPRTETGKLSTNSHAFADFSYLDLVKPFSEFQKKEKLTSAFGPALQDFINPATGNIHANYHICGTRSGRLSCSKPNTQQSPRDPVFRSLFVPSPDKLFICADYSSIEVRAAAELSRDQNMIKAYHSGTDIYRATAAFMNKKKIQDVTKEERQRCKCLVLGLQFGLGAAKLGHYAKKNYGVEFSEDESFAQVQAYRDLYSEFRQWQKEQIQRVADNKFVAVAPLGKLRKLSPDNAFGTALNHPIQSACASMMLFALIKAQKAGLKLVASIHDEIIIETTKENLEESKSLLKESMQKAYMDIFPEGLVYTNNLVDMHSGDSWGAAKA